MDFTAAKDYLEKRLNMPTDMTSRVISDEIPAQVRAHCFFSARVAESKVLDQLRGVSDAYSRGEIDLATARMKFKKWYDQKKPGERFADGEKITNIASTMRLNLVMRQNAAMAAGVGRYQVSRDPAIEERWPCWRYITGPNPRDAHAALDGKVFLKSDPVWHRIYPPWEFNCNCDVEDAELPEKGADRISEDAIPESDSGFRFDPADAFGRYDLSRITDPSVRFAIAEDMFIEYGDKLKHEGLQLRVNSETYDNWEDKNLESARYWPATPAPQRITESKGLVMLMKGERVKTPDGSTPILDIELMNHWLMDGDPNKRNIGDRLETLPFAKQTLSDPNERWDQETQRLYLKKFQVSTGGYSGFFVAVTNDGKCKTFFWLSSSKLDKARKGISFEKFK